MSYSDSDESLSPPSSQLAGHRYRGSLSRSESIPSGFSDDEDSDGLRGDECGGGYSANGMAFEAGPGKWHAAEELGVGRGALYSEDARRGRFPYCVVWTPLPLITWLCPVIGHLGICDSRGVCYDFAGPYYIGVDNLAFGAAVRVLRLDPSKITRRGEVAAVASSGNGRGSGGSGSGSGGSSGSGSGSAAQPLTDQELWDAAVDAGNDVYCRRMHNLCCDNCHSHVARCLNLMGYGGSSRWNMVTLALWMFVSGRYVSPARAALMWAPFAVIVTIIIVLRYLL